MNAQILLELPTLGIVDYDAQLDRLELAGAGVCTGDGSVQIDGFFRDLEKQTWLSKGARELFRRMLQELKQTPAPGVLEFEAEMGAAGMRWHRMQYACVTDGQGALLRIVGLSSDIQEERKQVNAWKKLAHEDTMTGLLNHEAITGQVSRAICEHDGGTLMLLDIDDFKKINDTLGHMQGDQVLKQVAGVIRGLFRREDLVGRYGGDEFLIFLPGLKEPRFARQKAGEIIRDICRIRLPILEQAACSIGIAIAEDRDTSLAALFKQADFALYEAKNFGKGHYVIIENGQAVHQICAREETKELDESQADQLTGALFSRLYRAKSLEEGIQSALDYLGRFLDLSRVYIFEQVEGGPIARNTFEWCNEGVESEIDSLQAVDTRRAGLNFYEQFDSDDLWVCADVHLLSGEVREMLERQNIRSMMHWAFRRNGKIAGIIGFDECGEGRVWGSRYVQILRRAGEIISEYLLSRRAKIASMGDLSERDLFEGLSNTSDNVYLFVCDMKRNYSKWSDNAVRYFGLPADYGNDTMAIWMEHIHPEDRAAYQEDINKVFSGEKARHYCQYRAKNREGVYVWMECIGNVVPDVEGNGAYFVGLMTRLDHQSKFDPVTKCLSVQQFYQAGPDEARTLLLIGMDEFRRVVNNFGYEAGNAALAGLAEVLRGLSPEITVYRMTGDEFLLVLPDGPEEAARTFFFHALRAAQSAGLLSEGGSKLSFSGGGVRFVPGERGRETAIRQLEHSLEHAKGQGRGSFTWFSQSIEASHTRRQKIRDALSRAIERGYEGFELYYQPIYRSSDHTVYGVEALLRFHTPELGMLSPAEFIPILEETREIRSVGNWVMEQAVAQKARWDMRHPGLTVGFNVSYLQLTAGDFVERLLRTVEEHRVDPSKIAVELTESCQAENLEELAVRMGRMKERGFLVALDDFGMEHSSFTLLRDLPVSCIKIDHSFVSSLARGEKEQVNLAIISSIAFLGQKLGLYVVAEGVENREIDRMIRAMGVDLLQGYHYSRPVPADEVEKLF